MGAVFGSFFVTLIKFIIFIAIACVAVICGKNYRIKKDLKKAEMSAENKDNE